MPTTYRILTAQTPDALEASVSDFLASHAGSRLLSLDVSSVSDVESGLDVFVAHVAVDSEDAHANAQPYRVRILIAGSAPEVAAAFNEFADANPGAWIGDQKMSAARFTLPREGRQHGFIVAFPFHPVAADGRKNWRPIPKIPTGGAPGGPVRATSGKP